MTEAAKEMMILRFRRKIPTNFLSVFPNSSSFCYILINIIWQWCSKVFFVSLFSPESLDVPYQCILRVSEKLLKLKLINFS